MVLVAIPIIAIGLLLSWFTLYAMQHSVNTWLGTLLNYLSHGHSNFLTRALRWAVGKAVYGVLLAVNAVEHAISVALMHGLIPVVQWIEAHANRTHAHNHASVANMEATADGFAHGFGVRVPREINKKVGPIPKWAGATAATGLIALRELHRRFARGIDTLQRDTSQKLHAVRHTVEHTIPREFGRVRAREHGLAGRVGSAEREAGRAWRVARKLTWATRFAGVAALVGAGLAKLGLNWIRCRNVGRVGRGVCGTDSGLLESLMFDTLAITSLISVVAFAHELQALEGEAIQIMKLGIRELNDL